MLNFSDLSIRRGTRLLFEHATFNLYRGEKIGTTGENGSFDMPGNLAVAHVAQELDASDQHAVDFVLDGDVELRAIEQQIAAAEAADDGHRHAEPYGHYDAIGGYRGQCGPGRALSRQRAHAGLLVSRHERRPVRNPEDRLRGRGGLWQAIALM
jgi:ATP-binding cassette subfamily F protein 3